MWALPDIKAMNAAAAANAKKLRRAARRGPGKKQVCEVFGCDEKATRSTPHYDIFSDDPKGLIHTCENHYPEEVEGFLNATPVGASLVTTSPGNVTRSSCTTAGFA